MVFGAAAPKGLMTYHFINDNLLCFFGHISPLLEIPQFWFPRPILPLGSHSDPLSPTLTPLEHTLIHWAPFRPPRPYSITPRPHSDPDPPSSHTLISTWGEGEEVDKNALCGMIGYWPLSGCCPINTPGVQQCVLVRWLYFFQILQSNFFWT